jgi:hypothetical protein
MQCNGIREHITSTPDSAGCIRATVGHLSFSDLHAPDESISWGPAKGYVFRAKGGISVLACDVPFGSKGQTNALHF